MVPTRSPTLSEYLTYWLTEVVQPKLPAHDDGEIPDRHRALPAPRPWASPVDKLTVATVQRYLNGRRDAGDSVPKLG